MSRRMVDWDQLVWGAGPNEHGSLLSNGRYGQSGLVCWSGWDDKSGCAHQKGPFFIDYFRLKCPFLLKELGDKPDGFTDLDDDTWSRVFEVSEMGKSGTDDHLYLMRNIHIPGKSVIYRGLRIQKTVAVNLMFLCQYSLKERDVREDFTVTGQDALESRKSTGALKYRLKVLDDDMVSV